jgi:hypothetical protein
MLRKGYKKQNAAASRPTTMFARRFATKLWFAVKAQGLRTAATVAPLTHTQPPYAHIQRGNFAAVWWWFSLKKQNKNKKQKTYKTNQ